MISLKANILTPDGYRSPMVLKKGSKVISYKLKPDVIEEVEWGEYGHGLLSVRYILDKKIVNVSLSPDVKVLTPWGFSTLEDVSKILVVENNQLEIRNLLSIINNIRKVHKIWFVTRSETFVANGLILKKT